MGQGTLAPDLVSTGCLQQKTAECWLGKLASSELSIKLGGRSGNQALTVGRGQPA